jgi:Type IV secretion-system coupling protein DNA-binding domain
MAAENITPIGITNHQNKRFTFGIYDKDRSGHIYCIGKTGTGKSTLLLNLAISDIQRGNGIALIDPHGDLANDLLNYIPRERIKDVIYFNVTDRNYTIAYNPLYNIPDENKHLVASNIVSTFKKLWIDSWGPRLEHILRYAILTLLYLPEATLLDIHTLLTDYTFRSRALYYQTEESIISFWQKEFEPLSPQLKNEVISPILNKIGILHAHTIIKGILGHTQSSFTAREVMDNKKIFIANLSKGYLGEAGTAFLGSLLVTQFQTASLERATYPIDQRTPFYLYIDEMHSFITHSFVDILSESRKYGLSLFLTHQFLDQLPEDIRTAILGNVGTLIVFRVGTLDAELLEKEFYPVFTREDIINIPKYEIYLKLLIDGTQSQPFSGETMKPQYQKESNRDNAIGYSQHRYCTARTKRMVKRELKDQLFLQEENKNKSLFDN